MFARIAIAVAVLGSGLSFAVDPGIPYQLHCKGAPNATGGYLSLDLDKIDGSDKIAKVMLDKAGKPEGEKVFFSVQTIGPAKRKKFEVTALFDGAFAGGGSLEATLSFSQRSHRGSWTEVTETFDETTSTEVSETRTTAVTCELSQ